MNPAGIEQKCAAQRLDMRAMRVAEDDRIGVRKPAVQEFREGLVRVDIAEAQRPQQRLRFLHPAAPIAVNEHDAAAFDHHLAAQRE